FNLKEHVESTLNLFQEIPNKFEVDISPKVYVLADEIKMGQVLYNFINNAIKHSNTDDKIIISAKTLRGIVTVNVIDFGTGISKDDQKHIWDRYTQINKHHTRSTKSSGLGLSIVSAICDATGSDYGV